MHQQSHREAIDRISLNALKSKAGDLQQCIEDCLLCHWACEQVIPYCIEKGGMHSEEEHIQLLLNCANLCKTSAHFMMWGSEHHSKLCAICAEICESCAQDCDRMEEDRAMQACAEICRACAESCRSMSLH